MTDSTSTFVFQSVPGCSSQTFSVSLGQWGLLGRVWCAKGPTGKKWIAFNTTTQKITGIKSTRSAAVSTL